VTNFLVALGILLFTLVCIYAIEWVFARRRPRLPLASRGFWFSVACVTDIGFMLLLILPALLFAVVILLRFVTRMIFGRERARTMWIESVFDWMMAIPLRMTSYRIVKPPQT
jgi:hypothetical protein